MIFTVAAIGIGSMLFHGTLTNWGQQLDELPMVWQLLLSMYCVNRDLIGKNKTRKIILSRCLLAYAVVFSALHLILQTTTLFQLHYSALLGMVLLRFFQRFRNIDSGIEGRRTIHLYLITSLIAVTFWLLDYHGCELVNRLPFNPQGHMMWHLFIGYSGFISVIMLKIHESIEAGEVIDVKYWYGFPFSYRAEQKELMN
jgi:dihydroceramidase